MVVWWLMVTSPSMSPTTESCKCLILQKGSECLLSIISNQQTAHVLNVLLTPILVLSLTEDLRLASLELLSQLLRPNHILRLLGSRWTNQLDILRLRIAIQLHTRAIIVFLCNLCCSFANAILHVQRIHTIPYLLS